MLLKRISNKFKITLFKVLYKNKFRALVEKSSILSPYYYYIRTSFFRKIIFTNRYSLVAVANIFPGAISNLFFPKIIEKYENKDFIGVSVEIKKVFWIIGFYCIALVLIIFLGLNTVVMSFFPKHIESLN